MIHNVSICTSMEEYIHHKIYFLFISSVLFGENRDYFLKCTQQETHFIYSISIEDKIYTSPQDCFQLFVLLLLLIDMIDFLKRKLYNAQRETIATNLSTRVWKQTFILTDEDNDLLDRIIDYLNFIYLQHNFYLGELFVVAFL